MIDQRALIISLHEIKALKFGTFQLKSGELSKFYLDLRVVVSYPKILRQICSLVSASIQSDTNVKKPLHLCGVPYTALPIATVVSIDTNLPMLIRRKEQKTYGTKKLIDGEYLCGDNVIVIEDVITTGESIMETVKDLQYSNLNVEYVIVIVDRQQGGLQRLSKKGLKVLCLFNITQIVTILKEEGKLSDLEYQDVVDYVKDHQIDIIDYDNKLRTKTSFQRRAELLETSKMTQKVFKLMVEKKTNLCVAADVETAEELLIITEQVAPHICILKVHIDAINGVTESTIKQLQQLAKQYNFLIMEDRKMADIGNTVKLQYKKIISWADLVTVHSISGGIMLKGIQEVIQHESQLNNRGVFIIAELSCEGNLITQQYTKETVKIAENYRDIVVGLVCQTNNVISMPNILQLTPGVNIKTSSDHLGQKYQIPSDVILIKGADVAVVGRGIYEATNPAETAKMYREQLWNTYLERISI
ncbi:uridine 5'-monophosphate synthase [Daktulosphaira vitifoliae]|uniref:uridine 5'-monophosphate synthase n=1 Tax=Daktulosphaira vitifoliae TaxID=58002 RepID=UPI0021AA26C6|nr:uridine 5'-monophosphate synthase [Daktulosphaira vitifoliae]